jgi:MFS family permease
VPVTVFAVLFIVQSQTELDRFDVGGLAVLAYSAGAAANGVIVGWLFSRVGQRPVIVASAVLATGALLTAAATTHDAVLMVILAGTIGLTFPPLHIGSRVIYPRILTDAGLLRVYSIDVSLIQISWILAPVAVLALSRSIGIDTVYLVLALVTAFGAVFYLLLTGSSAPPPRAVPWRSGIVAPLLRDGRMHVYLLIAAALLGSTGFLLPLLIAVMPDATGQSVAILVWSIGSALGSLVVNRRKVSRVRLVVVLGIAIVALAAAAMLGDAIAIDAALFLLGFATAPIAAAVFYFTSQHFRSRHQVVIFGAITSVQLVAEGVGTSVSGVLLDADAFGAVWAGVFLLLGAVLVLVGFNVRRAFTHEPVPRTDVVTVVKAG